MRVAFVTYLERLVLGLTQNRLAVNKVTFIGLLQALVDSIKLFSKELLLLIKISQRFIILFSTILFIQSLMLWDSLSCYNSSWRSSNLVTVLFIFSLNTIALLGVAWASSSKYSFLGCIRICLLTLCYEICLSLVLYTTQISTGVIFSCEELRFSIIVILPLWIICSIRELSRAPIDFREAESELVSGFNTETSSISFILLFLREYSSLLFISFFTSILFLVDSFSITIIVIWVILLFRATYVRVKVDVLIRVLWLKCTQIRIVLLLLFLVFSC